MCRRIVGAGDHNQVALIGRRTFVVRHVGNGHKHTSATADRHAHRPCLIAAFQQREFFCRKCCAFVFERIPRHRAAAPTGHEQIVAILRREKVFVVICLTHRDGAAHAVEHGAEHVGSVGSLREHPAARPTEIAVRRDVIQTPRHVIARQSFVVVVVGEQVPVAVEAKAATVTQATGDNAKVAAIGPTAKDATDARVRNLRPCRLAEKRPMPPMIGAVEVAVIPQRIAHRNVKIARRSPRQPMKTLMHMSLRHAPDEPFRLEIFVTNRPARNDVQRIQRQRVNVCTTDFDIVDPRMRRKAVQLAAGFVSADIVRLVHKQRLATADK